MLVRKARVEAVRRPFLTLALRECFVNILQHRSYEAEERRMGVLISPAGRDFLIEYEGSTRYG